MNNAETIQRHLAKHGFIFIQGDKMRDNLSDEIENKLNQYQEEVYILEIEYIFFQIIFNIDIKRLIKINFKRCVIILFHKKNPLNLYGAT